MLIEGRGHLSSFKILYDDAAIDGGKYKITITRIDFVCCNNVANKDLW